MKYIGSKSRIAKEILPIILAGRKEGQYYVEPFVGGANSMQFVIGNRIGADSNKYLISFWRAVQSGFTPRKISKEEYKEIKENPDFYREECVFWAGVGCSYSGKWFGGYAGDTKTKIGERKYIDEALKNLDKQRSLLDGVEFVHADYQNLKIPAESIIYCDPPYQSTLGYKDEINHDSFWNWVRDKSKEGHHIFVSEYQAPKDFKEVWSKEVGSSLSANGKIGGRKASVEKLFTI